MKLKITPKRFIKSILHESNNEPLPIKGLIERGKLFGFNANAIRVTITRQTGTPAVMVDVDHADLRHDNEEAIFTRIEALLEQIDIRRGRTPSPCFSRRPPMFYERLLTEAGKSVQKKARRFAREAKG